MVIVSATGEEVNSGQVESTSDTTISTANTASDSDSGPELIITRKKKRKKWVADKYLWKKNVCFQVVYKVHAFLCLGSGNIVTKDFRRQDKHVSWLCRPRTKWFLKAHVLFFLEKGFFGQIWSFFLGWQKYVLKYSKFMF